MMISWEFDEQSSTFYARYSSAPVHATDELADGTIVDVDADDNLVGLEILSMGRPWNDSELTKAFPLSDRDRDVLHQIVSSLQPDAPIRRSSAAPPAAAHQDPATSNATPSIGAGAGSDDVRISTPVSAA